MRDAWYSPKIILRLFWQIRWLWYVSQSVGVRFASQFLFSLNKLLKAWWWDVCWSLYRTNMFSRSRWTGFVGQGISAALQYSHFTIIKKNWSFLRFCLLSFFFLWYACQMLWKSHIYQPVLKSFEHKQEVVNKSLTGVGKKKKKIWGVRVCVCVCVCVIVMILGRGARRQRRAHTGAYHWPCTELRSVVLSEKNLVSGSAQNVCVCVLVCACLCLSTPEWLSAATAVTDCLIKDSPTSDTHTSMSSSVVELQWIQQKLLCSSDTVALYLYMHFFYS